MKKLFSLLSLFLCLIAIPVNAETVNITYRYMHSGNVWLTETKQATVGEAYPELHVQPQGVKYTTIPFGTVTGAETFTVNCELTDEYLSPYVSETYGSATWCFLSIRNTTKHLQYVNGASYIKATTTSRPSNSDTSYQWAFVGNPLTGYKIINKSAGNNLIMTSPAITGDGGTTTPLMAAEANINTATNNIFWKLTKREKSQAVLLSRWGEDIYMSNYGGGDQMKFWTSVDEGSEFYITPVDQTLSNQSLDTSKQYMLINRTTGKAMIERTLLSYWNNDISYNVVLSTDENDTNASALWTLVSNNGGYSLKNYASNRYLTSESESLTPSESLGNYGFYPPALLKTSTTPTQFYFSNADAGYYFLTTSTSTASGAAEKIAVGMDVGGAPLMGTVFLTAAQWELREVTPTTYVSTITSGRYYRLINNLYPNLSMTEASGKVVCMNTSNSETAYSQLWKITKSGTSYTLQNALTSKYIQTNPGMSAQFSTGTTSKTFTGGTTTANGNTLFYFYTSRTNSYTGLHCDASHNVVGWLPTADASRWLLQEVTIDASDLAAAQTEYNGTTNYTSALSTFFSDRACTTLNSTYQNYSDANLRSAMANAGLPHVLQEMGVSVKNNTWNTSEGTVWNHYEKDFRIHDYEIYSNNARWKQVLNTGPFAALTNPTGIQVKAGDIVYIMVGSNVKDNNASLAAELVQGTSQTATTSQTLTQGCNKFTANGDGEIFINYQLNSTTALYTSYPNITIHIEGGTCNGFFDMHRGHTNNDWAWLKENMFKNKYLHVKGNSVLLNVLYEGVKLETNAVGVMKIWDFIFDTEESFSGCDQYKAAGRYKMMINNFHNESGGNPYWSSVGYGTSHPNLTYTGVFNYNSLANGALWEVAHEMGHAHQAPIKWAGSDEVSNNVMSQIIQFLPKDNIGTNMFQSAKATRSDGVKLMTELFNNGWSFVDYARRRMIVYNDRNSTSLNDNLANRWLFQLWMYFDYLGNYQPTGGNNGFAFVSALHDKLRNSALGTDQVVTPANDYLKLAQYCAEITQTDLSEFFEAWGFWKTAPKNTGYTIIDENNTTSYTDNGSTYYVGGYTIRGLNMSSAASQVNTVRNAMKAYTKKGGHIMFIEDRGVGCTLSETMDGLNPQTLGDHGYYGDYGKTITGSYKYNVDTDNNTVSMSGGENAVGFKIYDGNGNLVAISNMNTFSVPATVAAGLANNTYTLVAAQGNGTDVTTANSVVPTVKSFTLNCARGYIYGTGTQIKGTATASEASELVIVPYDGNTYLYDATNKAFVCHTTDAQAGTSGNVAVESSSDFSKIVKGLTWGETNIATYPLYLEDSWGNWLNMDGGKTVYMNTWKNFEGGAGGNTYAMTIVDTDFDITEAVAMLEAYFNPSATVTYVLSDANGVIYTSNAIPSTPGTVITALPDDLKRPFCSYSAINKTLENGANSIAVTVTYDAPFDAALNTDKLYYATLRNHYVYYDATNNDVRTNQTSKETTEAYQWSFYGNPYEGIRVKNASTGTYLDNTETTVQLTATGYAWTLHRLNNTTTFGLYNGSNHINEQNHTNHNLIYWWAFETDAGSQWNIEEVPDVVVDVTYNLVENGTTVNTVVVEGVAVNSAVSVPSSLTTGYSPLAYDFSTSGTIGTTNCTITVTATLKAGVVTSVSSLSNSKAYMLTTERGSLGTDGTQMVSTNGTNYTASNFAIINYEGLLFLYSVADSKWVGNPTTINSVGNQPALTNDLADVTPVTLDATDLAYPFFFMGMGSNGVNVSNYVTGIVVNSWTTRDPGNQYVIIENADFDATAALAALEAVYGNAYDDVVAEILPYIFEDPTDIDNSEPESSIGTPFGISAAGAASIISTYQSQLANRHFSLSEYQAAKALLEANILYPEEGKTYLVKNVSNNMYLRVAQHGTRGQVFADLTAAEAAADALAHFTIKVENNLPYIGTDGHYFNWTYTNYDGHEAYTIEEAETLDKYAHFVSVAPGVGAFSLALGNGEGNYAGYLDSGFYALKNGTTTIGGSTTTPGYASEYAQWIFEEFTAIEGDLNGDTHVDTTDLNILIGIIFGTNDPTDYNNADLNGDNTYSVGDVTKLINIMQQNNNNQ